MMPSTHFLTQNPKSCFSSLIRRLLLLSLLLLLLLLGNVNPKTDHEK